MASLAARLLALAQAVGADVKAINTALTALGGFTLIKKVADESRTSSATLTADNTLKVTLGVGQWRIRLLAAIQIANATMDYKYDLNFTGTATWKWNRRRDMVAGAVAGTDVETTTAGTAAIGSTSKAGTTSGIATVEIDGVINVSAQGELQFRWAQDASNGSAIICLEGSTLEYVAV